MKAKKKIPYYILGAAALVFLALLGGLRTKVDGSSISVITGVMRLPREALQQIEAESAFRAGATLWLYTLLPVVVSIPSASYIYEELKSGFYMGTEFRKGRYRYIYSRFLYSAVSGALTVVAGLSAYALFVCCVFPVNPVGIDIGGYIGINVWQLGWRILAVILYMAAYGMVMSALASFLVYVYPNLYVDLSLVFIVSYILRETAMKENFVLPLSLISALAIVYGIMWRVRSEHI